MTGVQTCALPIWGKLPYKTFFYGLGEDCDFRAACEDLKRDLVEMLHDLASAFPQAAFAPLGQIASYSVRDAYRRFAGWDPFDPEQWAANSALFDEHMVNKVEPALARHNAVFLEGYPPPCASLAKIEHGVAKRWEFYLSGMELANCFTELTDAGEQDRKSVV